MLERAAHRALAAERRDGLCVDRAALGLVAAGRVVAARDWLERLPGAIVLATTAFAWWPRGCAPFH
jgi:hypothetical protein